MVLHTSICFIPPFSNTTLESCLERERDSSHYVHQYPAVPLLSDLRSLPNLTVDSQYMYDWWQIVFDVKQKRPELDTVIMNGMIIAIHRPECELHNVVPIGMQRYIYMCIHLAAHHVPTGPYYLP